MSRLLCQKGIGFGIKRILMLLEYVILDLKDEKGQVYYWSDYVVYAAFCKKKILFHIPFIRFLRKRDDI